MTTAYPLAPQNDDVQGEELVQCMYSQTQPSLRCKVVLEQHDLEWAQILRQTLGVCPPRSPTFRHILEEYGRAYLCRHHRDEIDINHNGYWQERLDQWIEDLNQRLQTDHRLRTNFSDQSGLALMSVGSGRQAIEKHRPTSSAPTSPRPAKHSSSVKTDLHRRNKSNPDSKLLHREMADSSSLPSISYFSMYKTSSDAASTFEDVVTRPLTIAESNSGYIYAYKRITGNAQDQHYIRIGYSTQKLDDYVRLWSPSCQYFFELVCPAMKVKNAARVETLIHKELELSMKRRVDVRCKLDPTKCQSLHDNWFEVGVVEAEAVMQYWASWMESQDPYDNNGRLQPELRRRIDNVGNQHAAFQRALYCASAFNFDSKGRIWHDVRLKSMPSPPATPATPASTTSSKATRASSSKKGSRRTKPAIPQRKSSLNLGPQLFSASVPHLPLKISPTESQPMPNVQIPRHKTSVDLRSKFNSQYDVQLPNHPPLRSKSLASFRAPNQLAPHDRFASIDSTFQSALSPPSTKSLKRRHRNSSLRSLVSMQNLAFSTPGSDPSIMEATIIRREKCRSIYIGAPTVKKISIMNDLSRIQMERS